MYKAKNDSWDELHSIIDKIESLDPNDFEERLSEIENKKRFSVIIDRNSCFIVLEADDNTVEIASAIKDTKKEAVVLALNDFFNFYKFLTYED